MSLLKLAGATVGLSPEDLEDRKGYFNASTAPRIMGGNPKHVEQAWLEATGQKEPEDLSKNQAVLWGSWSEPLNAHIYTMTTGCSVGESGKVIKEDWLRCTLDGMTTYGDGYPAVFEAKHVSIGWKGEDEATVIKQKVAYYMPQIHIQMWLADVKWAVLSIFLNTNAGIKLHIVPVPFDEIYWVDVHRTCEAFWNAVQTKTPPEGVDAVQAPEIAEELRDVDMTGQNEWAALAADWLETKTPAAVHKKSDKGIKELIEVDVGLAIGHGIQVKRAKNGSLRIGVTK